MYNFLITYWQNGFDPRAVFWRPCATQSDSRAEKAFVHLAVQLSQNFGYCFQMWKSRLPADKQQQ